MGSRELRGRVRDRECWHCTHRSHGPELVLVKGLVAEHGLHGVLVLSAQGRGLLGDDDLGVDNEAAGLEADDLDVGNRDVPGGGQVGDKEGLEGVREAVHAQVGNGELMSDNQHLWCGRQEEIPEPQLVDEEAAEMGR